MDIDIKRKRLDVPKVDQQNPKTILRRVSHLRMHKVEQLMHGKGVPPKASLDEKIDKLEMKEGLNGVEIKIDDVTTAVITYNNIPLYHVKED